MHIITLFRERNVRKFEMNVLLNRNRKKSSDLKARKFIAKKNSTHLGYILEKMFHNTFSVFLYKISNGSFCTTDLFPKGKTVLALAGRPNQKETNLMKLSLYTQEPNSKHTPLTFPVFNIY